VIQVFQIWHTLVLELTSAWTFKIYSRNTKRQLTNQPQVITQTDH